MEGPRHPLQSFQDHSQYHQWSLDRSRMLGEDQDIGELFLMSWKPIHLRALECQE